MLCNTHLQFAGQAGPGLIQVSGCHPELVPIKGLCPISVPSRPRTVKQVRQEQHFSKQFPPELSASNALPSWPRNEGSRCAGGARTVQPGFHPGPFSPDIPGGQSTRSLGRVPRSQSQELTKVSAQCCLVGQTTHEGLMTRRDRDGSTASLCLLGSQTALFADTPVKGRNFGRRGHPTDTTAPSRASTACGL